MKNKTKLAAVIGSIVLGSSVVSTAQAGALAQSVVLIDNFTVSNTNGVLDNSDFNLLEYTGTTGTSADLTGFASQSATDNTTNGGLMDLRSAVGAGGPADNAFSQLGTPPVGANFAVSDTYDFGSPISGLTAPLFSAGPADLHRLGTAGYVSLTNPGVGSADSNNSLEARVNFQLNEAGVLDFNFEADVFVQAFLNNGAESGSFATASAAITFSLIDTVTGLEVLDESTSNFIAGAGFDFAFGGTRSSNAPGDGVPKTFSTGGFTALSFSTDPLLANRDYQLVARMNSDADAGKVEGQVPEPESLVLIGLGLLGMVFRKKATKA